MQRFFSHMRGARGSAMLMVLIAAVCVSLLIALGYSVVRDSIVSTKGELSLRGQVYQVAASGIFEAVSWFRSRRQQPVKQFNPKPSAFVRPGEQGIVRNFLVSESSNLWGRYVVSPEYVEDISDLRGRGKKGSGIVWRIRSQGILYSNANPAIPYNQAPNKVIHRFALSTEIQRLNINPPAASAIIAERGDQVEILEGGRLRGYEAATITVRQGTGKPVITIAKEVTSQGSNVVQTGSPTMYSLEVSDVFGVTWRELKEAADVLVDDVATLPAELPHMGIVFIEGNAVFTHKRPLNGGGVLIVGGDLQIAANSNSSFSGLIYVKNNLAVDAPALISGTVIVQGSVRLQGVGDFAEIQYNKDLLSHLKQRLGQYRQTQPLIKVK